MQIVGPYLGGLCPSLNPGMCVISVSLKHEALRCIRTIGADTLLSVPSDRRVQVTISSSLVGVLTRRNSLRCQYISCVSNNEFIRRIAWVLYVVV